MLYSVFVMANENRLDTKTQERLKELGVAVLYLYGSEASGLANRFSDIDLGIVLQESHGALLKDRQRRYELHSELTRLLEPVFKPIPSRELDLVFLQTASPVLQFQAINTGQSLFAVDPVFQADYEAAVVRAYLDVRPLVEVHFQAAIERAA